MNLKKKNKKHYLTTKLFFMYLHFYFPETNRAKEKKIRKELTDRQKNFYTMQMICHSFNCANNNVCYCKRNFQLNESTLLLFLKKKCYYTSSILTSTYIFKIGHQIKQIMKKKLKKE